VSTTVELAPPEPPTEPIPPRRQAGVNTAVGLSILAAVGLASASVGWFAIWSRAIGSDEAYLLTSLREWVARGGLYDRVYSQYGPFYYLVFGAPSRLLGLTWTVDAGRFTNLVVWTITAFLLGLATWRLTTRLAFGVAAQVLAFSLLHTLTDEPMHPGALICLLLACLVCSVTVLRPRAPRLSDTITGGLLAGLTLTKVNVGVFAIVAVAFVALEAVPDRVRRLRILGWAAIVALGPVVVFSKGVDDWTLLFAATYVVAAVAVVIASSASRARVGAISFSLPAVLGGAGLVGAVTVGFALATGTSVAGLWNGVVVRPREFIETVAVPVELPPATWIWLIVLPCSLLAARALIRRALPTTVTVVSGVARLAGGAGLAAFVLGRSYLPNAFNAVAPGGARFSLLPLAALVLVPRTFDEGQARDGALARRLLAAAAITQSLHTFPVPGSQVSWSLLLAAVCGAVMIGDGVAELVHAIHPMRVVDRLVGVVGAGLVIAIVLILPYGPKGGVEAPGQQFVDWFRRYHTRVPVNSPGTDRVRVTPNDRNAVRRVVTATRDCDTLFPYKVTNAFLAYSNIRPPTGYTPPIGLLLTGEEQASVVRALESQPRACVLFYGKVAADGTLPVTTGSGPLSEYLGRNRWEPTVPMPGVQVIRLRRS
jgi:hypothetical protein